MMLVACAGKDVTDLNTPARHREALFRQASAVNLDTVLAGLDVLISTKNRLRGGGHLRTLMQMALIRLCRLEDLAPISQVALWLSQPGSVPAGPAQSRGTVAARTPSVAPLPEAKKKADPTKPVARGELNAESLPQIWAEVLAEVGPMLAKSLENAVPAISGPKGLVLSFGPEYTTRYQHCTLPDNVQRVESALRERTGLGCSVRLERSGTLNGAANGQPPPTAAAPRQRPQDTIERFPLLQRVVDVFHAIPMAVDSQFGETQSQPVPATAEAESEEVS
jgi:DNA polymerase-3 subunit gamma/tau